MKTWSRNAWGGRLYWGARNDVPVRPPIYVGWWFVELHLARRYVGITR